MGCGASTAAPPPKASEPPPNKAEPLRTSPPAKGTPVASESTARSAEAAPAERAAPRSVPVPPPEPTGGSSSQSSSAQERASVTSTALPEHLRTDDLIKLCQDSHFDKTQVEKLYELFKVISSSGDDDGLIDKSEFQKALGLKRNLFVDRMFELFDINGDQNINFQEFVAGLSTFTTRAKPEEKTRFSFRMYDFNGDQKIDKSELGRMLQATIDENKLDITAAQAQKLIDDTFEEAKTREEGFISLDEYTAMVNKKPQLLEFMTIQSLNSMLS